MGIDAVIVNHTKRRYVDTAYRLHSFALSPGPNFIDWLVNARHVRGPADHRFFGIAGSWHGDSIEVLGSGANEDDDVRCGTKGYMMPGEEPYDIAENEKARWIAYWNEPTLSEEERRFCAYMRGLFV